MLARLALLTRTQAYHTPSKAKRMADDPLGTPWPDSKDGGHTRDSAMGSPKKTKVKGWRATHSQALGPADEGEAGPQQATAGA